MLALTNKTVFIAVNSACWKSISNLYQIHWLKILSKVSTPSEIQSPVIQ